MAMAAGSLSAAKKYAGDRARSFVDHRLIIFSVHADFHARPK